LYALFHDHSGQSPISRTGDEVLQALADGQTDHADVLPQPGQLECRLPKGDLEHCSDPSFIKLFLDHAHHAVTMVICADAARRYAQRRACCSHYPPATRACRGILQAPLAVQVHSQRTRVSTPRNARLISGPGQLGLRKNCRRSLEQQPGSSSGTFVPVDPRFRSVSIVVYRSSLNPIIRAL